MSREQTPNLKSRFHPTVTNPWESDSRAITAIRNCLILAEQMGLRTMPKENEQRCAEQLANLPSTKIIEIQREISSKTKTLYQLQKNVAAHIQEKEAGDFLQITNIEKRINMITQLCTDLDKVMQNTEALIHRLRKPFVGEYIKIHVRYHRKMSAKNQHNSKWTKEHLSAAIEEVKSGAPKRKTAEKYGILWGTFCDKLSGGRKMEEQ
ncbi:Augmin subunit 2-like [Plakobranchus ocellatus]|uniref:Augmin subunit 2-like n=1 Tax=Plakobranchus ocellatus TaxID=259542 RepID=A0AAV4CHC2_9GAST|nr:Augmin subunit 2-like [Plakobranchus ocellatus]